jgi:hypothetical protein
MSVPQARRLLPDMAVEWSHLSESSFRTVRFFRDDRFQPIHSLIL